MRCVEYLIILAMGACVAWLVGSVIAESVQSSFDRTARTIQEARQ